jgi:hypothetical protein
VHTREQKEVVESALRGPVPHLVRASADGRKAGERSAKAESKVASGS